MSLVQYSPDCLRIVAAASRMTVSRKSLPEAMEGLDVGEWLQVLVSRGHTSPLEHCSYTFEAVCSRACSHQLVRHRIASYTQQSMRYTDGLLRMSILRLCTLLDVECPSKPSPSQSAEVAAKAVKLVEQPEKLQWALEPGFTIPPCLEGERLSKFLESILYSLEAYYDALAHGVPMEDARYLLPHAVKTRIVFTMNARELLEVFIPLRTCRRAQWEIRMLAWSVRWELVKVHPELWRYSGPRCIRLDQLARRSLHTLEDYVEGRVEPIIENCPEGVPRHHIVNCILESMTSHSVAGRKGPSP